MEHVSQAVLFLEDAGDLGQALSTDVDEMSMDEQVQHPAALHTYLAWVSLSVQCVCSGLKALQQPLSTSRHGHCIACSPGGALTSVPSQHRAGDCMGMVHST